MQIAEMCACGSSTQIMSDDEEACVKAVQAWRDKHIHREGEQEMSPIGPMGFMPGAHDG